MQRLHASQGVGDHGDGAGRHEGDVVGRPPQSEGVVGRAGEAQRVVRLHGLALVVVLVLQLLLLHLQRHELLALQVRHVVGGGGGVGWGGVALGSGDAAVGFVPSLVFLVVKRGEGEDVQEEQGGSDGDCDAQLRGVVPLCFDDDRRLVGEVAALALVCRLLGVRRRDPWVSCRGGPVVLTWEAFRVRVWRCVLGRYLGCCGHVLKKLVDVVQMWNEFQPERHLGRTVVVSHSGFEADVKVELVFWVVLRPGHLLKPVGLRVDELCVLWNRLVRIPETEKRRRRRMSSVF